MLNWCYFDFKTGEKNGSTCVLAHSHEAELLNYPWIGEGAWFDVVKLPIIRTNFSLVSTLSGVLPTCTFLPKKMSSGICKLPKYNVWPEPHKNTLLRVSGWKFGQEWRDSHSIEYEWRKISWKPQWECLTFSDLFASKQKVTAKCTDAGVTASVHYFQGVSFQGVYWHQKVQWVIDVLVFKVATMVLINMSYNIHISFKELILLCAYFQRCPKPKSLPHVPFVFQAVHYM